MKQPGYESDADPHAQAEGNGGSLQPDAEISDDLWAGVAPDVEADTEPDARANAEVAAEIMAHDLTTMLDEYGMEPRGDDPEFPVPEASRSQRSKSSPEGETAMEIDQNQPREGGNRIRVRKRAMVPGVGK